MTRSTDQRDLIEVLIHDHREVEAMFAELESGTGDAERRRRVADAVIAELVRHSVGEEEYLYPTARRALADGDAVADREIAEHAQAERTMKRLEGLDATDPEFSQVCTMLMTEIRQHVQEEETDLFPRLRSACGADELRDLGRKVELAKKMAPTHPHPSAPDTPPANLLAGPLAGLVDRVRDVFSSSSKH